jgi:pyruvate/2-oxoglutarate/acetoin dehydrogenase E1 component
MRGKTFLPGCLPEDVIDMTVKEMTYREAIVLALQEEMRRDARTLIMGEDIGPSGGPFKTCQGLYEEFGGQRVRDTPIAETGFVGAALGLALAGYRPIAEIMFADFLGVCFDQIVNGIAKHRFMSGGQVAVPLVIRAIGGAGQRFGPQHSTTAESWFLSVPGLTIACPSTPNEAYRMLKAAIRDNNPVVLLEHKGLLGSKGPVTLIDGELEPLGGSREVEVIDVRVLRPMDLTCVFESVRATNHLVTVEEQAQLGGWGAEVAAQVVQNAFDYLDAPPARVCLPEYPVPYSPPLEDDVIPSPEKIASCVRSLLKD